jgi:hypothetical protein
MKLTMFRLLPGMLKNEAAVYRGIAIAELRKKGIEKQ